MKAKPVNFDGERACFMKIVNIMNFVRTFEPRDAESERLLFPTAKAELDLSLEMDLPSTFLLEYDALCDERYVELYRSVKDNPKIELGIWYEIVEPLTSAIGIPYNSARGYRWDWNIDPGYSMSYDLDTRRKLIDEAMRKFNEVFGFYPRTVGSWVLDTFTTNHLAENYNIDAFLICRDQINTDAYTMVGGYFSGGYYPSRNNVFTPGSDETRVNVPVFRLLGADPIHNYDSRKYMSPSAPTGLGVYTLEPASEAGKRPEVIDWFFDTYYGTESIGMAYTQIGQENSFSTYDLITPLRFQYENLIRRGVKFMTTSETGRLFKSTYERTPVSTVSSLKNWDTPNAKSIYYDCESYTANLFFFEGRVSLRSLYLFDDRVKDTYLTDTCTTFDSIHENLPLVDTYYQRGDTDGGYGLIFDTGATFFTQKINGDSLTVDLGSRSITFTEEGIRIQKCKAEFTPNMINTTITLLDNTLYYEYKGHKFALRVEGGRVTESGGTFLFEGDSVLLIPTKI